MRAAWRVTRRLARHELVLLGCLARWLLRRGPHGAGPGERAFGYAAAQFAVFWIMLTVSVVETVALALLIPWPLVHAVLLVFGVWGTLFAVELHISCVVRPHLVGADGSLRLRYGALVDIRIPAELVADVRVNRRFRSGGLLVVDPVAESADLAVAGQTTVTVELTAPVTFHRPLGRTATARLIHCHADTPEPFVATWRAAMSEARTETGTGTGTEAKAEGGTETESRAAAEPGTVRGAEPGTGRSITGGRPEVG